MTDSRRVTLETQVDTTGARAGFNEITRQAGTMANAVRETSQRAQAGVSGIGSGAGSSAQQIDAAQRNIAQSIQRTAAAMQSGSRTSSEYYESLARQRGVDPATLAPFLAQLRQVETAQKAAAAAALAQAEAQRAAAQTQGNQASFIAGLEQEAQAIGKTRLQLLELRAAQLGVTTQATPLINQLRAQEESLRHAGTSAGQTAAALRGLPAQMSDIAAGIQGGQSPLTILLQQGGQIKDTFGGVGNAIKGVGTYVKGLVNPYTIAAAAVAVLGLAYIQGASEAKAHRAALIASGNAAGTTADQLQTMAANISKSVGTQANAAAALDAFVATGKVGADNLQRFSEIAIKGQRNLGQSVEDTAGEFADLARSPLQTLEKLNDKYHFLNGSIYSTVKTLQDQGRAFDAGKVAQEAYANAFDGVSSKTQANLGYMQKRWIELGDFAKSAWDKMLNIGREDTLDKQLSDVQARLAQKPNAYNQSLLGRDDYQTARAADQATEASLQKQINLRDTQARISADQARFNAADLEWSKDKFQYMTRQQQLDTELTATQEKGLAAGISDIEITERMTAVRKKYSDVINQGIDANIEKLKQRAAIEDAMTQRAVGRIGIKRDAGDLTEVQAIRQAADEEDRAFARRRANLVAEGNLMKSKPSPNGVPSTGKDGEIAVLDIERSRAREKANADVAKSQRDLAADSEALSIAGLVSAANERQSLQDSVKQQREYNDEIGLSSDEVLALRIRREEANAVLKDEAATALEAIDPGSQLAQIYRDQAQAIRDRYMEEREGAARLKDPWTTLSTSLKRYGEEADNTGQLIGDTLTNAFKGADDAFADFVTTGKLSFSSLATSIVADLARIAAKKAIAGFVGSALDAASGDGGGWASAFKGLLDGARATGGPVTGGASYLVGERGPEIFTPNSTGSITPNNMIGSVAGGSGAGAITVITNVTADGGGQSSTTGDMAAQSRTAAEALSAKIKDVISQEQRQGGLLWKMAQGRG
jgi:lambda family phage tail tape measure protein